MKITKEKVIYFLSLNLILDFSILPTILFFLFKLSKSTRVPFFVFIYSFLVFFFLNLITTIIYFFYSDFKKEKFNNLVVSVIVGIIISILFLLFFTILIGDIISYKELLGMFLFTFLFTFIFSLIILIITDPLRQKIKW